MPPFAPKEMAVDDKSVQIVGFSSSQLRLISMLWRYDGRIHLHFRSLWAY